MLKKCLVLLTCVLICCSLMEFDVKATTLCSFGNSAIGTYTDKNDANVQSVSYFKAATTGSITDIMAYVSGVSSGKATAALYAVNGNIARRTISTIQRRKYRHNTLVDRLPTNNHMHCNCRHNLWSCDHGQCSFKSSRKRRNRST